MDPHRRIVIGVGEGGESGERDTTKSYTIWRDWHQLTGFVKGQMLHNEKRRERTVRNGVGMDTTSEKTYRKTQEKTGRRGRGKCKNHKNNGGKISWKVVVPEEKDSFFLFKGFILENICWLNWFQNEKKYIPQTRQWVGIHFFFFVHLPRSKSTDVQSSWKCSCKYRNCSSWTWTATVPDTIYGRWPVIRYNNTVILYVRYDRPNL